MASSFLKRLAEDKAKKIDKEYGASAYGGSASLRPASAQTQSATNGGGDGAPVTRASNFLTRLAKDKAAKIDKEYGSGAYGGSAWTELDKDAGFNSWLENLNSFSRRMSQDYTYRDGVYQTADAMGKYRDDAENSISVMRGRSNIYRDYFQNNRDLYGDEEVDRILSALDEGDKYLSGVSGSLGSEYDFWAQFEDEDDYKNYQRLQDYKNIPQAQDFQEKSQYRTTANGQEAKLNYFTGKYTETGYDDILYDAINGDETARSHLLNSYTTRNYDLDSLTQDQIKRFNYLYATQGADAAYEYLDADAGREYTGIDAIAYGALQGTGLTSISALLGSGYAKLTGDEEAEKRNQEWYGEFLKDASGAQEQHPYAYGAGSVGGNLALLYGVGAGLGAAEGALATGVQIGGKTVAVQMAPAVQGIVNSGLSFLAADAAQNAGAAATGYIDVGDYLKSVGISGAQGIAGGLAGGLVGSGMAKILKDTGMMTPFMEFVRQTTTGFASAGANIGTGYALRDEKPTNEQIATDLTTAFLFSVIQGGISTYKTTQTNKSKMSAAYEQIVSEYSRLSQGWEQMTPEARADAAARIAQYTQNLRTSLNSYYMAGQQASVDTMNQALDAIEAAMNQYVSGFASAQASTAAPGNMLGGAAAGTSGTQESADLTAQVQQAVELGLTAFHENPGNISGGMNPADTTSGIAPAAAANGESTGADILSRAAEQAAQDGSISGKMADRILADHEAVAALMSAIGHDIPDDMPQAQRRQAVKTAVEELARRQSAVSTSGSEVIPLESGSAQTETQEPQRTDAIMVRDMQAVERFGHTMGKAGAKALSAMYDPSVSAETYLRGMNDYYNAGLSGTDLEAVDGTAGAGLSSQQKEAAYLAGQADAASKTEVTSYGTEEGQVYLRNGSERADSADTGRELRPVAESAGRDQSWEVTGRPADSGATALSYGEAVSTASLGIGRGAANDSIRLITGGETEAMKSAKAIASERGLRVTFFAGSNLTVQNGEQPVSARAYISGDRAFIRVDHPEYTADQLMRHEAGHDMIAKGEIDPEQVRQRINDTFGKEKTDALAGQYEAAYRGSGLTADEVWEEVICDSLGDMNIFHDIPVLEDNANELLEETKAASIADLEANRTRGPPPADASPDGKESRDLEERRRALRKGEMVNQFLDKINWPAYYQELTKSEYNPDFFDDGAMAYMSLDGSLLTLEMQRNGEWSVIDMKEVIGYGDTGSERGRKKSAAKDGAEWLPRQREDDGHRSDLGRAGAVDGVGGASGQRGNGTGDGEIRSADYEAGAQAERNGVKEKFSMETPIEETKNLLAIHNKDEASILSALELGGLPMPSIAVVKSTDGHSQYGPISLVFSKDTIDPQADIRNKVYGSDAWTPTHSDARVDYEVDYDVKREFEQNIETLAKDVAGGIFSQSSVLDMAGVNDQTSMSVEEIAHRLATRYDSVRAAYLANKGQGIDIVYRTKEFDSFGNDALKSYLEKVGEQEAARLAVKILTGERLSAAEVEMVKDAIMESWTAKNEWRLNKKPELRETRIAKQREKLSDLRAEDFARNAWNFYEDGGTTTDEVNRMETAENLRHAVDDKAVEAWVLDMLRGLTGEPGIYNGSEMFDALGNRKSFKETHWSYTLENIVRAMNNAKTRGQGMWGMSGSGLVATATPAYNSVQEMHADERRLRTVDSSEYEQMVKDLDGELDRVAADIMHTTEHHASNTFEEEEIIGDVIAMAAQGKRTTTGVKQTFRKEGYTISDKQASAVLGVIEHASRVPTGYFEAKPQRAVGFDEVLAAVIPDDSSEKLRAGLERAGVRMLEYKSGDDADRLAKVNSVEGARFSQDLAELDALRKENERLKGRVEHWKGQLKQTTPETRTLRQGDVDKLARHLVKEYGGTLDASIISEKLKSLGEFIIRGGDGKDELTWEGVHEKALDIARDLVENAVVMNDDMYREYSDLRNYLRTTKIIYGKEYHGDIPDYGDFRKGQFGRLNLGSDGATNIDQVYQELSSRWPEFFNEQEQSHPTDQLLQIVDVLDGLQPIYENPYSYDMAAAEEYAAGDILDSLMGEDVRQEPPTYADRQARKLEDAKAKGRQQVQQVREQANERLARQREQSKQRMQTAIARERKRRDERVQQLKDHYAEVRKNQAARRADSKARTRLLNIARRLQNKKLPAVNRALLDQYIGDLDTVSKGITGKTLEKLSDLQSWYNDRKENDPDFISDPNIERTLSRLSKRHISDMTADEVADLTRILLNIENELRTEHKLIDEAERRDTYHLGQETIQDIYNTKGSRGVLDKFIVTETLSPLRQVRRMTGYVDSDPLYKLTQSLADGQRAMLDYQMKAERPFEKFASDKAFSKTFSGPKAEGIQITGFTKDGAKTVTITPAMRVSLYLHSLNDQNLRHIKEGGITVPDEKLYRKGKLEEAYARGTTIKLTPSQVRAIAASMTEKEKAFARAAHKYFNETSRASINATSEKLKGYSLAQVDNYFPINTDGSFTRSEFETLKRDGTIEGMGFLKERVRASNPILLRDANSVLEQAIRMHGKYVGLAIPVRNFNKVWSVTTGSYNEDGSRSNYDSSVQQAVKQRWGDTGYGYIEKLMTDLQGGSAQKNVWVKALNKVRSNYAGAVLTLNLSVAMKQAASYPTAAAVLGWKPLARAMADFGKVDLARIEKYTPLQWYRSKGFSTKELGDLKTADRQLPPILNWVQGVDLLTTRKLWKASEYYVRQNNKELSVGTDAYWRAVADIYNRVIEETQPNYTTMQRPQLLRSDDTLMGNLAMFKTQPFQNFNIVYDAAGNYISKAERARNGGEQEKADAKKAKSDLGHAITSQLAQLAVFAGMTMVWALLRGKTSKYEDDDGDMTVSSIISALGKDMAGGALSGVPFGSDAWELLSSKVFGDTYYGMDAVTVTAISDTIQALGDLSEQMGRIVKNAASGKETNWNSERLKLDRELDSISKAAGVPYENVVNLFKIAFLHTAVASQGEYLGGYAYLKLTTDPEKYASDYYDLLFRSMQNSKADYETIYADMVKQGYFASENRTTEEAIASAMEQRMKDAQGVKKVSELDRRYLSPGEEKDWDRLYGQIKSSNAWSAASEEQRSGLEDDLYDLVTGTKAGEKLREKIDAGVAFGIDDTDYLLYRLALSITDKPTESGNMGSYTNDEVEEAINMLTGLSDEARGYLWTAQGKSEKSNPWG